MITLVAHYSNPLQKNFPEDALGDFGAASFYDSTDPVISQAMARLEVRAFGCLLEDLLDRCAVEAVTQTERQAMIERLRTLQQDCMTPVPSLRPLFHEICARLEALNPAFGAF